MARTEHLDLGDASYSSDDEAVHGGGVYDRLRGRFETPLRMSVVRLPMMAAMEGFPTREQLEESWHRAGGRCELRHTALWQACTCGGEARVWQVRLLEQALPVGTPAREAVEMLLAEHLCLHIGASLEAP